MPVDEKKLMEEARSGKPEAVDALLSRYAKSIYRFGLRMCGTEADAQDVLQETLLAAFKGLEDFRGDAQLSTWLYQVARSFCIKKRRRRAGEPASMDSTEDAKVRAMPSLAPAPEQKAQSAQLGEALATAMAALSPEYREVIVLRDVEGLSAEEAARVVGIEVGALKSRLHRARMEMRGHLSALLEPQEAALGPGCPELAAQLSSYAAAEIDQTTCAQIERHLQSCAACAGACDTLKRTVSLCRTLPGGEVPVTVQRAVRTALLYAVGRGG